MAGTQEVRCGQLSKFSHTFGAEIVVFSGGEEVRERNPRLRLQTRLTVTREPMGNCR